MRIPERAAPAFFYQLVDDQKDQEDRDPALSMHPFRLFKMWESAVRFTDLEFVKIFRALLDANVGMVSGSADPRLILEQLVSKIAG